MELCINFALPIECYDNMLNKCAGRFCHVETSLTIDVSMLRFLFDAVLEKSYAPNLCQSIVNNLQNKQNIGLTKTLNRGIELSNSKYIARIDQDDVAYNDRLQIQRDI